MEREQQIEAGTRVTDLHECTAEVTGMDHSRPEAAVIARLDDGSLIAFPFSMLRRSAQGYRFDGNYLALKNSGSSASATSPTGSGEARIPVVEEELHVGSRTIETGAGVRVTKRVHHVEETVDLPLVAQQYHVERIARDEWVADGETPQMREEADGTLILPVLEEVLVVHKRMRLREEIRITRSRHENHSPQRVVLRREEVEVQNFGRKGD